MTGIYALQAGVEPLIGHDMFLHHTEFCDRLLTHTTTDDPVLITDIDWPAPSFALDNGQLPYSSGELKTLRLAPASPTTPPSASTTTSPDSTATTSIS